MIDSVGAVDNAPVVLVTPPPGRAAAVSVRRTAPLIACLAGALALGGCTGAAQPPPGPSGTSGPSGPGSPGGAAATSGPAAPAADVAWMDRFCGQLVTFATGGPATAPTPDGNDPAAVKNAVSAGLHDRSKRVGDFLAGLSALGAGPVGSADLVAKFSQVFTTARTKLDSAAGKVDAVSPADAAGLQQAMTDATTELQSISDLPDQLSLDQTSQQLDAAARQASNCRQLQDVGGDGDSAGMPEPTT
jgi:hypothetical protein